MVQSINLSHIFRCFYSPVDFDDDLKQIDASLKEVREDELGQNKILTRSERIKILEEAFKLAILCFSSSGKTHPDKELAFLFGDLLRQYGRSCTSESFFTRKQLFLASLQLLLYAIGFETEIFEIKMFKSLDSIKEYLKRQPNYFAAFETRFFQSDVKACVDCAHRDTLALSAPARRLHTLSDTIMQLGTTTREMNATTDQAGQNTRFKKMFELSKGLLNMIEYPKSSDFLGRVYFEMYPFIRDSASQVDVEQECVCYDKALAHDTSLEMKAFVAVKRFEKLFYANKKQEAFKQLEQLAPAVAKLAKNERNQALVASINYHRAVYFLDLDPAVITGERELNQTACHAEKAHESLKTTMQYVKSQREQREKHLDFVKYEICNGFLQLHLKNYTAAQTSFKQASDDLQNYPEKFTSFEKLIEIGQLTAIAAPKVVVSKDADF